MLAIDPKVSKITILSPITIVSPIDPASVCVYTDMLFKWQRVLVCIFIYSCCSAQLFYKMLAIDPKVSSITILSPVTIILLCHL